MGTIDEEQTAVIKDSLYKRLSIVLKKEHANSFDICQILSYVFTSMFIYFLNINL